MLPNCPDCEVQLVHSDSGEPDCLPGLRCPECDQFWTYEDYLDEEEARNAD